MNSETVHPDNHIFTLDDLILYLEKETNKEKSKEIEQHILDCSTCQNTIDYLIETYSYFEEIKYNLQKEHLKFAIIKKYLDEKLTQNEKLQCDAHLKECKMCKMALERLKFGKITIDDVLSELNQTKQLSFLILQDLEGEKDEEAFNESWDYYFDERFDWDAGKYNKESISITDAGYAFAPSSKDPLFLAIIKIVAEIRSWVHENSISNIKDHVLQLQKYLASRNFKDELIDKIIFYIQNK